MQQSTLSKYNLMAKSQSKFFQNRITPKGVKTKSDDASRLRDLFVK